MTQTMSEPRVQSEEDDGGIASKNLSVVGLHQAWRASGGGRVR